MKMIAFKISGAMDEEIRAIMLEEGFLSKGEFFRFLFQFYKHNSNRVPMMEGVADLKEELTKTPEQILDIRPEKEKLEEGQEEEQEEEITIDDLPF